MWLFLIAVMVAKLLLRSRQIDEEIFIKSKLNAIFETQTFKD
jgi:hypothetical protein